MRFCLQLADVILGKLGHAGDFLDGITFDEHGDGNFIAFVILSLQVRALFFVKHVRHSVNLIQKGFIRVPLKRYIIRKVLVKEPFQFFFGDILVFKDITVYETWDFSPLVELSSMRKNPQHFGPIGLFAVLGRSAVFDGEKLLQFYKVDV